jgi:hypothetical protein
MGVDLATAAAAAVPMEDCGRFRATTSTTFSLF